MKEEDIPSRVLLNLASQVTPSHRGGDDMAGSTKEAAVLVELCTSAYLYVVCIGSLSNDLVRQCA